MKVTQVTQVTRFRVKSKSRDFLFFYTILIGVKNGNFSNLGNFSVNGYILRFKAILSSDRSNLMEQPQDLYK